MKFKRYIMAFLSSALVFGFSLFLFPQVKTTAVTDTNTTPTPTASVTPTATPAPTFPVADNKATATPVSTPSPEPIVTEPPEQKLPIGLTDNELSSPISGVSELVTAYIHAYYSNDTDTVSSLVLDPSLVDTAAMEKDSENIKTVENIELYKNPGINGTYNIVYACYSLYYKDLQLFVPQFSEYYVKRLPDGSFRIQNTPLSEDTNVAFLQARQTEVVQKLAISSLIRRYHAACLVVSEPLLEQCVTDTDYLNIPYLSSRYSVTENFTDYDFLLYPGINEFDFIVFVTHSEKIVFSDTPAPCMEYYYVDVDDVSGLPRIYLGITSLDTDAYCAAIIQNADIQELANQTNLDMQDALRADDDLQEFYQLLISNASA